jgi:acetone carboxylase gamma subunit
MRPLRAHRRRDPSRSPHATKHARAEHHPIIHSFEPDEDWFYDYDQG